MLRGFLSLLCLGLFIAGCEEAAPRGTPRFAIFLVDENVDDGQAPPDADRVPSAPENPGLPVAFWLRREGGMSGPFVTDARVIDMLDGRSAVEFTLTQEGRERLATLTRLNVGRQVAVVVNGAVVASSIIAVELPDGKAMLSGNYTAAQARSLAQELIATSTP